MSRLRARKAIFFVVLGFVAVGIVLHLFRETRPVEKATSPYWLVASVENANHYEIIAFYSQQDISNGIQYVSDLPSTTHSRMAEYIFRGWAEGCEEGWGLSFPNPHTDYRDWVEIDMVFYHISWNPLESPWEGGPYENETADTMLQKAIDLYSDVEGIRYVSIDNLYTSVWFQRGNARYSIQSMNSNPSELHLILDSLKNVEQIKGNAIMSDIRMHSQGCAIPVLLSEDYPPFVK